MRNYSAQLWLGAWLLVLPFLGVPGSWKETLTALTALVLIGHALLAHHRRRTKAASETEEPTEKTAESPKTLDSRLHGNDTA